MRAETKMKRSRIDSIRSLVATCIIAGTLFTPLSEAAEEKAHRGETSKESASSVQELRDQMVEMQARLTRLETALTEVLESELMQDPNKGTGAMDTETGTTERAVERRYFMRRLGDEIEQFAAERAVERHHDRRAQLSPVGESRAAQPDGVSVAMEGTTRSEDSSGTAGLIGFADESLGASALPGFAGASHLYHVGATGLFLDHADRLALTLDQRAALRRIRERILLDKLTMRRQVDGAEQELWALTAADRPEAAKVADKIRAIERLRADLRIAFVQAVGEAVKLLTEEQRLVVLGHRSPVQASQSSGKGDGGQEM